MTEDQRAAAWWEAVRPQVEALMERRQNCHVEVACPTCAAPVGKRCRAMPRGYRPLDLPGRVRELRSPHRRRANLVVPER